MNTLSKQLQLSFASQAQEEAIVQGNNFRFTVLTERLIRMEYDPQGEFDDRPSQIFWYRKQPVPGFEVTEIEETVTIETKYLKLVYKPNEAGFISDSLKINLKKLETGWQYGDENEGNLGGTVRTLDTVNGSAELDQGLLSRAGWSVVDDTESLVFDQETGWLKERKNADGYQDLYFFGYGNDYIKCLQDFTKVAGEVPLLPRWVLGNWWSRYWDYSQEELKSLMEEFKEKEVPLSVCIVDMDWHIVNNNYTDGWTGYTWNKELFPEPDKFIDWLHEQGLKTALNLHPADGIHPHEDKYEEMAKFVGQDPKEKEPVEFDITDPQFINGYFEVIHNPLEEEEGVDFWWIDWQQGQKSKLEGLDPLWGLNHLHFLDRSRNRERRPFIFSRWSGLGSHRYPIGFSGDTVVSWDSLAFQPYFTATASNVGYGWWSHDIGGHCQGQEDPELYARWVQFGVFSPIMRLHCTKDPYLDRRPWGHGEEVYQVTKEAMQLRHALIPYLYTMSWKNYKQGISLINPMYYHYPEEEAAYSASDQYYFGSELLAAPYVKPKGEETNLSRQAVWLPEGNWFNFFTGEHCRGDSWHVEYGELNDIPVFAREGAIVPLGPKVSWGGIDNPDELKINIFPGADNSFELYEDSGEGLAYQDGEYAITEFCQQWEGNKLKFKIKPVRGESDLIPEKRDYQLIFKGIKEPEEIKVLVDKQEKILDYEYNKQNNILTIKVERIKPTQQVKATLVTTKDNLIFQQSNDLTIIKRMLKKFRMPTAAKWGLEKRIKKIKAGESSLDKLRDYSVVLSDKQFQALVEVIAGVGVKRIKNREQNKIILWGNNDYSQDLVYQLSVWDTTKSHSTREAWSKREKAHGYKVIDLKKIEDSEWELKVNYFDLFTVTYND